MSPRTRILIPATIAVILVGVIAVLVFSIPEIPEPTTPARPKPLPGVSSPGTPVTGEPAATLPSPPLLSPVATVPPAAIQGPPSFRLLVVPVEARARPGEAIQYTMTIEPGGGFNEPVSLRLDVRVLFLYHESFDLGTVDPPYPKSVGYRFVVPGDVPRGITVKAVLTGEGGGARDTVSLVLVIS
ncbi:MAG TPA: hypothetical protein PLN56_00025 [Methanoregulaceae archaeon]|nr:MAG: hypothetical protein IPI71_05590 [Methanolinea sp.]HON80640.1 hypothetical protein [Methanoregulaceae archaeon]HPD09374.1 hypothetical protein [Methanoregulaceae archaeon]HRT14833.1 hypothetical protein [Methanoregulaceae archaeon]HRU30406.1 hypothetical protein [Methanoregulaceae archaeon]